MTDLPGMALQPRWYVDLALQQAIRRHMYRRVTKFRGNLEVEMHMRHLLLLVAFSVCGILLAPQSTMAQTSNHMGAGRWPPDTEIFVFLHSPDASLLSTFHVAGMWRSLGDRK
jgi:hypothetical protein